MYTPIKAAPRKPLAPKKPRKAVKPREVVFYPIEGLYTNNFQRFCRYNTDNPEIDEIDPATALELAKLGETGSFYLIGDELYTKNFSRFLNRQFASAEERDEYMAERTKSAIKCDCCYLRSVRAVVATLSPFCPMCSA